LCLIGVLVYRSGRVNDRNLMSEFYFSFFVGLHYRHTSGCGGVDFGIVRHVRVKGDSWDFENKVERGR
jgi:hypothetical protein